MLVIPTVRRSGGLEGQLHPGDAVLNSKVFTPITTVGAGTWTGAAIAGGLIRRTGPTAAYTDTTDTAQNILSAVRGNAPFPESMVGLSMELYVANGVAFAHTFAGGRGVTAGVQGGSLNIAASGAMDYLITIQNDTPEITVPCSVPATGTTINFILPPGMTAFKMGPAPDAVMVTPGMLITGAGISPGITVRAIRMGQGGIIGVTSSANVPGSTSNSITFSPVLEFNNVGN